jgi:hypothetical protein
LNICVTANQLSVKQINGWDLASENTASIETAFQLFCLKTNHAHLAHALLFFRVSVITG